ncbi:hypothetical protein GW17_00031529 [Ensete ventricosum]|nr:hypothetical protein GW17_00031529 [Ensete ventricosum]
MSGLMSPEKMDLDSSGHRPLRAAPTSSLTTSMASSSPSPPASSSSRSRASGAPVHLALAPLAFFHT